jgi:hypothetical protein
VGFSTKRCLLVAPVSSASLFLPRLLPAKIAAVALSAVAMRADAEDGFTSIAASWTKQGLRHVLDDKPPLRFGDDAEGSLSNRRVIQKPRFLMRGDTQGNPNASANCCKQAITRFDRWSMSEGDISPTMTEPSVSPRFLASR